MGFSYTQAMTASSGFFRIRGTAAPEPPPPAPQPMELSGFMPAVGVAHDIFPSTNLVYVACERFGLSVVDVRNASSPIVRGAVNLPFDGDYVTVSGSLACVTGTRTYYPSAGQSTTVNGLYLIDVSVPEWPRLQSKIETTIHTFGGLSISGNYLYVACGDAGIKVFDISNRSQPALAATADTPGWANSVTVSGNYAYVADGAQGLRIFNISNPRSPTPAGFVDTPRNAKDLAISGTTVCIADMNSLQVIDARNPNAPAVAGSLSMVASRVRVQGTTASVAQSATGVGLVDISNPSAPRLTGNLPPAGAPGAISMSVAASGQYLYIANSVGGLGIAHLPDPSHPTLAYKLKDWFQSYKIATKPGLAVITGSRIYDGGSRLINGVVFLNTTNPAAPKLVGKLESSTLGFWGLAIAGNYAYIACAEAGLAIVDISNPQQPVIARMFDTPGVANSVKINGSSAYVADGAGGLRIIDIRNPLAPIDLGNIDTPGTAKEVAISGSYAYVADVTSVQIIDIRNPSSPSWVGSYGAPAVDVKIQNTTLFAAANSVGLCILNVSNPSNPVHLSTLAPPSTTLSTVAVWVSGTKVYVANGGVGVGIVDVANPSAPVLRTSLVTTGNSSDVIVDGNWVCAADSLGSINTLLLGP